MKDPLAVASGAAIVIAPLGPDTLHRRPGLDQRAVHQEAIPAEKAAHQLVFHHAIKQLR